MMKKIQDYSLIAVFVMTAILAAVAGLKAYSGYMKNRAEEEALFQQRKEEILARNAEAQNRVQEMQVEIIELQSDVEALQTFIDDAVNAANEVQSRKAVGNISGNGDASSADAASGNSVPSPETICQAGRIPYQGMKAPYRKMTVLVSGSLFPVMRETSRVPYREMTNGLFPGTAFPATAI